MTYYIASLKHTQARHEHIVFWGPDWCGHTPVVGRNIGLYSEADAAKLNDGLDCIAVPVEAVTKLLSPEPYYKPGARFYDQEGPVVDNTRRNWNALLSSRLVSGRTESTAVKPKTFQGPRRSFSLNP